MNRGEEVRRLVVAGGMILLGWLCVYALFPSLLSIRDFTQDYLMARALREGISPYESSRTLWFKFFPGTAYRGGIIHPSPHTPTMALLVWPLSFFPPTIAYLCWLLISYGALWMGICWLQRTVAPRLDKSLILACCAFSVVGRHELQMGQVNSLLFLSLCGVFIYLHQGREWRAGIALGLVSVLKFFGWPLLLLFALQRRWRTCLAVVGVWLGIAAVVYLVFGRQELHRYVGEAVPAAHQHWGGALSELSAQSLVVRVSRHYIAQRDERGELSVPPPGKEVQQVGSTTWYLSSLLGILVVLLCVAVATRVDAETALLRCSVISCIASPIAWRHGLLPCLLPLALLSGSEMRGFRWSHVFFLDWWRVAGWLVFVAFFVLPIDLVALDLFFDSQPRDVLQVTIPWWLQGIHLMPTLATMFLAFTLCLRKQGPLPEEPGVSSVAYPP